MKNKLLTNRIYAKMPLNIQYFAETVGDSGAAGSGGAGDGGGTGAGQEKHQTFDELLAAGHQEEFDRRVKEAVDGAVKSAREKWEILADDRVSEAEKLAKMTAQEKAKYLQDKKEKELADREAQITRRELMATAKNTLTEKGIPLEMAEILNYADAESCNKSIAAVEKAFQGSVEKAVEERLKGGNPPKGSGAGSEKTLEEQIRDAMNLPW